jgi:hypothetical protein
MRRFISAVLLAAAVLPPGGPAVAAAPLAITRESQRDLMVTIYNGNLGLVKDTREARLPAGMSEVQFADVAAQIDPTSVHLKSLTDPAGLRILEQNYEYDLLSAQKPSRSTWGRRCGSPGERHVPRGDLLSTDGPVYDINGAIHMGHQGRSVPVSYRRTWSRSRPSCGSSGTPRLRRSGWRPPISPRHQLEVGLRRDPQRRGRPRGLTGWVTIDNKSGATYKDAALKLVAGDVNRARDDRTRQAMELAAKSVAAAAPASRDFVSEGFFEYHLYTLDGRTTIKDKQTKQLTLMSAANVPVRKELAFFGAREYYRSQYGTPMSNQKVSVFVELTNAKANNLGVPLPKGKMRVYKADKSGSQQLIGEDWIDHTPQDEKVRIKMGESFDVVGERTQRDWKKIGGSTYEVEWEISLRNHKKEDVVVSVIEPIPGDWEVLRETQSHEKLEAHTLRYRVPVPAEGAAKVTYRVRLRF